MHSISYAEEMRLIEAAAKRHANAASGAGGSDEAEMKLSG
jgi:hypothetical protein